MFYGIMKILFNIIRRTCVYLITLSMFITQAAVATPYASALRPSSAQSSARVADALTTSAQARGADSKASSSGTDFQVFAEAINELGAMSDDANIYQEQAHELFSIENHEVQAFADALEKNFARTGSAEIDIDTLMAVVHESVDGSHSSTDVDVVLRLLSANPVTYRDLTGIVSPMVQAQATNAVTLNRAWISDDPYAGSIERRNGIMHSALSTDPLISQRVHISNITYHIAKAFSGKRHLLGSNYEEQMQAIDIAALAWLFVLNPKITWHIPIGTDEILYYSRWQKSDLFYGLLNAMSAKIINTCSGDEGFDGSDIDHCPQLQEMWEKGMFSGCNIPQHVQCSRLDLRRYAIDPDINDIDGQDIGSIIPNSVAVLLNSGMTGKDFIALEVMEMGADEYLREGDLDLAFNILERMIAVVKHLKSLGSYDKDYFEELIEPSYIEKIKSVIRRQIEALDLDRTDFANVDPYRDEANLDVWWQEVISMGRLVRAAIEYGVLGDEPGLLEKFMLFSAAPGTGKDYATKVTFDDDHSPLKGLYDRGTLYHSRAHRPHKNEKDGWAYHFRGNYPGVEEVSSEQAPVNSMTYLKALSKRPELVNQDEPIHVDMALVNRQEQALAMVSFVETDVRVDEVEGAGRLFNVGDIVKEADKPVIPEEDADDNHVTQRLVVVSKDQPERYITISITGDTLEHGKIGAFCPGDIITEIDGMGGNIRVSRQITGLSTMLDSNRLAVMEGGIGWFLTLKNQERRMSNDSYSGHGIFAGFITPFDLEEEEARLKIRRWVESNYHTYQERAIAHNMIFMEISHKSKELKHFTEAEMDSLLSMIKDGTDTSDPDGTMGRVAEQLSPAKVHAFGNARDYGEVLLQNASAIESESFIAELNLRLADFGKPAIISEKDKSTARMLAYELNRRICDRDPVLYITPDPNVIQHNHSDERWNLRDTNGYDRFNRLLEGTLQIMNRDDYVQAGGVVIVNRWAYTTDQAKLYNKALRIQFAGSMLKHLLLGLQTRFGARKMIIQRTLRYPVDDSGDRPILDVGRQIAAPEPTGIEAAAPVAEIPVTAEPVDADHELEVAAFEAVTGAPAPPAKPDLPYASALKVSDGLIVYSAGHTGSLTKPGKRDKWSIFDSLDRNLRIICYQEQIVLGAAIETGRSIVYINELIDEVISGSRFVPDIVLLDLHLDPKGITVQRLCHKIHSRLPSARIVLIGHTGVEESDQRVVGCELRDGIDMFKNTFNGYNPDRAKSTIQEADLTTVMKEVMDAKAQKPIDPAQVPPPTQGKPRMRSLDFAKHIWPFIQEMIKDTDIKDLEESAAKHIYDAHVHTSAKVLDTHGHKPKVLAEQVVLNYRLMLADVDSVLIYNPWEDETGNLVSDGLDSTVISIVCKTGADALVQVADALRSNSIDEDVDEIADPARTSDAGYTVQSGAIDGVSDDRMVVVIEAQQHSSSGETMVRFKDSEIGLLARAFMGMNRKIYARGYNGEGRPILSAFKSSSAGEYEHARERLQESLPGAQSRGEYIIQTALTMLESDDPKHKWTGLALAAYINPDERLLDAAVDEARRILDEIEGARAEHEHRLRLVLDILPYVVDKHRALSFITERFSSEHYYIHKNAMAVSIISIAAELGFKADTAYEYLADEMRLRGRDCWRRRDAQTQILSLGTEAYINILGWDLPVEASVFERWLEDRRAIGYTESGQYDGDERRRSDEYGYIFRVAGLLGLTDLALKDDYDADDLASLILDKIKRGDDIRVALQSLDKLIASGKLDSRASDIADQLMELLYSSEYSIKIVGSEIAEVLIQLKDKLGEETSKLMDASARDLVVQESKLSIGCAKLLARFDRSSAIEYLRQDLLVRLQRSRPDRAAQALIDINGIAEMPTILSAVPRVEESMVAWALSGRLHRVVANALFDAAKQVSDAGEFPGKTSSSGFAAQHIHGVVPEDALIKCFGSSSLQVQNYSELAGSFRDDLELYFDIEDGKPVISARDEGDDEAQKIAEVFTAAFELLETLIDYDPKLKVYYTRNLLGNPDNRSSKQGGRNVIRFSTSLKRDSARYFNKNAHRMEIIFNIDFIQRLKSEYVQPGTPVNVQEPVACILGQRLFHELGHSNARVSQYEQTREEYEIVKRDLELYQLSKAIGFDDDVKAYYEATFPRNTSYASSVFNDKASTNSQLRDGESPLYAAVKIALIDMRAIEVLEDTSVDAFVAEFRKEHEDIYEELMRTSEEEVFANILTSFKGELIDYEGGYFRAIIKLDAILTEYPGMLEELDKVIIELETLEAEALQDFRDFTSSVHDSYQPAHNEEFVGRIQRRAAAVRERIQPYVDEGSSRQIKLPYARPYSFLRDYISQLSIRAAILAAENLFYLAGNQQTTVISWRDINLVNKLNQDGTIRQYLNFAMNWSQALGFGMTRAENEAGGRQSPHTHPNVERTLSLSDDTWVVNHAAIMDDVIATLAKDTGDGGGGFEQLQRDPEIRLSRTLITALSADVIAYLQGETVEALLDKIRADSPDKDFVQTADAYRELDESDQAIFEQVLIYIKEHISPKLEELEEKHGVGLPFGHISYIPPEVCHHIKNRNPDAPSADCTMKDLFLQLYRIVGKPGISARVDALLPLSESTFDDWGKMYVQVLTDMASQISTDTSGQLYFKYDERGRYNPVSTDLVSLRETLLTVRPHKETGVFNLERDFGKPTSDGIYIMVLQPWPRKIPNDWQFLEPDQGTNKPADKPKAQDPNRLRARVKLFVEGSQEPVEEKILSGGEQLVINNRGADNQITHIQIENLTEPDNADEDHSTIVMLIPTKDDNNPLKNFGGPAGTKASSAGAIIDVVLKTLPLDEPELLEQKALRAARELTQAMPNETYLYRILESSELAAIAAKEKIDATAVFNDESVPAEQRQILKSILGKETQSLAALQERLGITVRLKSELSPEDIKGELIVISTEKLTDKRYKKAKYLIFNPDSIEDTGYIPVAPMIAMAKGLLILKDSGQQELILALKNLSLQLSRQLMRQDIDQILEDYLINGTFALRLPAPETYDVEKLEKLQRAALAALIAA
ncbi:hypothetical protein ACFL0T_04300 [Candidatus Omnitrophota bacterium]